MSREATLRRSVWHCSITSPPQGSTTRTWRCGHGRYHPLFRGRARGWPLAAGLLQVGARRGRVDFQVIVSLLVDRLAFPKIRVLGSSGIPLRGRGCARPWREPRPCPATTSWPCLGRPSGRRTPAREACTSTSPPADRCVPST